MKRLGLLVAILSGCGPATGGEARIPAGIEIRGIQADQISAVQLTVLANGSSLYCPDLAKSCLNQKIKVGVDTVPVRGDDGKDHNALRVSNFTSAALLSEAGVSFSLSVPAGTDYMVVAEILSADAKLLASGCSVIGEVFEGEGNSPLIVTARPVTPVPTCDPRID